jgi:hypothetical protein
MAFWNSAEAEPLRQFRWYINFGSTAGLDSVRYALKKADKPKAKVGEITHKYLNHSFYYPGRLEWEAINLTFASITSPSMAAALKNILTNSNYLVPSDENMPAAQMKTLSKKKFATTIGELTLVQINAEGQDIETWKIRNPFFTSVQWGALDYGSDEIVECTCTVRYDWAELAEKTPVAGESTGATPAGTGDAAAPPTTPP